MTGNSYRDGISPERGGETLVTQALPMSEAELLLSTLRDIQEPAAPVGVSLWLLAANILMLAVLVWAFLARRHRRQEAWRREAQNIISLARDQPSDSGLLELARLLRQLLLHRDGQVHTLDGDDWLLTLDQHFATDWFSTQEGRVFGIALYQPTQINAIRFDTLCDSLSGLIAALPAIPALHRSDADAV
mgnify:CR=1 FL=1